MTISTCIENRNGSSAHCQSNVQSDVSSDCIDGIIEWIERVIPDEPQTPLVVVLEGGHFNAEDGAELFSIETLRSALAVGENLIRSYRKRVRIMYSILVNDLGMACGKNVCTISQHSAKQSDALPPELEAMLQGNRFVKRNRVVIATEKHCRNRGLKLLKTHLEHEMTANETPLVIHTQDHRSTFMFQTEDGHEVEIAFRKEKQWTVKCPLIMAGHYRELIDKARQRCVGDSAIAVVDFSELSDRGKVTRGTELALRIFGSCDGPGRPVSILNVFWANDFGDPSFLVPFYCGH